MTTSLDRVINKGPEKSGPFYISLSSHNFLKLILGDKPKTELTFVQCRANDGIGEKHFSLL